MTLETHWQDKDRRSGDDRRSGTDRRRKATGLRNAFLFKMFLDRRTPPADRRKSEDRRDRPE